MKTTDNVLKISYSTLPGLPIPWNTAELYEEAARLGFDGIKGDVTPTRDGRLIMCHDSYFALTEQGRVIEPGDGKGVGRRWISHMSAAQCKALEYANEAAKKNLGYYAHVSELEDLIRICKRYGKLAYITVRDKQIDLCVDEVYRLLEKYEMKDQCIINSFSFETLSAMRKRNASIRLSLVFGPHKCLTRLHVNRALALGNCAVCVFWTRDELMAGGLLKKSKAAMAYASEKGVPLHLAHAWDEESYRFALVQGFCGFQCTCTEIL